MSGRPARIGRRGRRPGRLEELALIRAVREGAGRGRGVRVAIGDDCAVLDPTPGAALVATTDLLLEDVHFRRRYAEPADIGWKALAVNLSDIASMGAEPRWALIALACPAATRAEEVDAFYEGLLALAGEHGVAIVGGDTASSPAGWLINVTVLGETLRSPLLRSGARAGDVVAVTGSLGRSAAGLALLARRRAPAGADAAILADAAAAHLRPRPRVVEGRWLGQADGVTAMIDLSDGLVTDLQHIAEESRVGARVDLARIPIADATRRLATVLRRDAGEWATSGGEDYELLLTCVPAEYERLARGLHDATGTRLTAIGEVTDAGPVRFTGASGREVRLRPGFEHFVTPGRR